MKAIRMLILALVLSAGTVMAGGDKVRGDNGQGGVKQVQVQDPPPFQQPASSALLDVVKRLLGLAK